MVKTTLVEADLIAGWRLLVALHLPKDRIKIFRIKAAFWLYYGESEEWRLVIATPLVDEEGPLDTYTRLQPILFEIQPADLYLQNISVTSSSDPLARAFRKVIIPRSNPYARLPRSAWGGTYVEGAYLYRVPPLLEWNPDPVGVVERRDEQAHPRPER